MGVDVAAGAVEGVAPLGGLPVCPQGAQPLQRPGDELGDVRGEHGEDGRQVRRVPFAGHVGLAEADESSGADAAVEDLGVGDQHGGTARAEDRAAVAEPAAQREPAQGTSQHGTGDGGTQP